MDALESVNFHIRKDCNYKCLFCFHNANRTKELKLEEMKEGLRKLKKEAPSFKKLNISGGEPFLNPKKLGDLVKFCKEELNLIVGIISNGSLITEEWVEENRRFVDYLGVSCDSFDEEINVEMGRHKDGINHVEQVFNVSEWCRRYEIQFKLNVVVTTRNVEEDMNDELERLQVDRFKVFQLLILKGENDGSTGAKRDARPYCVSPEDFDAFIERHKKHNPVREDNATMKDSYIILDEQMRFLNCQEGNKEPGQSILDSSVSVMDAFRAAGFESCAFKQRGGDYYESEKPQACVADIEDMTVRVDSACEDR